MVWKYDKTQLKSNARKLRNGMTDAERKLWSKLRGRQINNMQFYRQRPIGKYIVDFYCPARKLVIEIDGGQHYEDNGLRKDQKRTEYLNKQFELKNLRFNNLDVLKNIDGVILRIADEIN